MLGSYRWRRSRCGVLPVLGRDVQGGEGLNRSIYTNKMRERERERYAGWVIKTVAGCCASESHELHC